MVEGSGAGPETSSPLYQIAEAEISGDFKSLIGMRVIIEMPVMTACGGNRG
jgi:hypothetical protein